MSILSVQNGERGNGLNTGSHKHKVKCRHQRKGQSQHSFANQRIIITDFLAQPSQQLNINKLVAPSCALSFSYHHHFPSLHSIFLCFVFLSFPPDPSCTILHHPPPPPPTLYIPFIYENNALFNDGVQANIKQADMWIKKKKSSKQHNQIIWCEVWIGLWNKLLSWSPSDVQSEISHTGPLNGLIWMTTVPTVSQQAAQKDKAVLSTWRLWP